MAEMIREAVGASKIRHFPLWMAKSAAKVGDLLKIAGWRSVPLTSFRLNNILTEYIFDMSPIMEIAGPLPYELKTGVEKTVQWLRESGEI
jgi:hypothetical protein